MRLAEAPRVEAESACARHGGGDAAGDVSFVRPELQGDVAACDAEFVLCGGEVEEDAAVFEDGGGGVFGNVAGDRLNNLFRRLCAIRGRGSGRGHEDYGSRGANL